MGSRPRMPHAARAACPGQAAEQQQASSRRTRAISGKTPCGAGVPVQHQVGEQPVDTVGSRAHAIGVGADPKRVRPGRSVRGSSARTPGPTLRGPATSIAGRGRCRSRSRAQKCLSSAACWAPVRNQVHHDAPVRAELFRALEQALPHLAHYRGSAAKRAHAGRTALNRDAAGRQPDRSGDRLGWIDTGRTRESSEHGFIPDPPGAGRQYMLGRLCLMFIASILTVSVHNPRLFKIDNQLALSNASMSGKVGRNLSNLVFLFLKL